MRVSRKETELRIRRWVRMHKLSHAFVAKGGEYYRHDAIHVTFGLTINEEGLVLAIEHAWETNEKPSLERFEQDVAALSLDTDRIELDRIKRVHEALWAVWPITFED